MCTLSILVPIKGSTNMMSTALTRAATAATARAATMVTGTALAASEVTPRLASYSPALTFITELMKTNKVLDRCCMHGQKKKGLG